jgi:hypothetical protein
MVVALLGAVRKMSGWGVAASLLAPLAMASPATDPCSLLAASEAQIYVGTLMSPPFRANDEGAADPRGNDCVYRGSAGRQLSIRWRSEGAAQMASITTAVPNTVGSGFEKAGQPGMGATAHRVIAQGPEGPWDNASWIPGGTLFVTKGDRGADIDMSGASGKRPFRSRGKSSRASIIRWPTTVHAPRLPPRKPSRTPAVRAMSCLKRRSRRPSARFRQRRR